MKIFSYSPLYEGGLGGITALFVSPFTVRYVQSTSTETK